MATFRYSTVNNKCVVELPGNDGTLTSESARQRDFQIGEDIGSIGVKPVGTGQTVSLNFPLGYAHDINPAVDTVILAGVTIAPGSQTAAQLANTLRSSAVFLKPSSGGGGGTEINEKAKNLLSSISKSKGLPIAMAAPPTMATATASSITGIETPFTSDVFQYLGSQMTTVQAYQSKAMAGNIDKGSYRAGGVMNIYFSTNAPQFEFITYATADKYRIFVNDEAVSLSSTTLPNDYQIRYVKATFAASAIRNIRIEIQVQAVFSAIKIPNNYTLWKTDLPKQIRGMIVGDSYCDGVYGDAPSDNANGLANQLGFKMGLRDFWLSGQSSEGYAQNGQNGKALSARILTDVIPYAPDYLVIAEGINDAGKTPATVQANASAIYAKLLSDLPNTIITVIGPWRAPGLNPASNIFASIKSAVESQTVDFASKRIMYIDTLAENWQQIAGKVGTPSGTGNSNVLIGADGIHFVQVGHDYGAEKIYRACIKHLTLLANQ